MGKPTIRKEKKRKEKEKEKETFLREMREKAKGEQVSRVK